MVTGTLYITLDDGIWQTAAAAYLKRDPMDDDRVIVLVFPPAPSDPPTMVPTSVVSASTSGAPPIGGEYIYVSN